MTSRISGIFLVARHINSDPEPGVPRKFTSGGHEFMRFYAASQIWTDRVRAFWAIGSTIACQEGFAQYFRGGRKRIAHAVRNYRLHLKSGDSYLFREEERSRGFGSRSINYFSFPSAPTSTLPVRSGLVWKIH